MEPENPTSQSTTSDAPETEETPVVEIPEPTATEPELKVSDKPEKVIDRQPLPFDLSLIAHAPWKSLVLITLALVFGWADWRFAQTWRVPAQPTSEAAQLVNPTTVTTGCFTFTVSLSVLGDSNSLACDAYYQFGAERIARLRVTALRRGEQPIAVEDLAHTTTENPVVSEITLGGVKAQQTVYIDMGRPYIDLAVTNPPKPYSDNGGAISGFQLIAPYSDKYGEKSSVDEIIKSWSWH